MLNDEKEPHIRRAVFLPMYYTVISLMVMLSFLCKMPTVILFADSSIIMGGLGNLLSANQIQEPLSSQ